MVLAAAALVACGSRSAPTPLPAQPWQMTNAIERGERGMMNCPSAVPGATTRIQMTEAGVDVAVTAPDPRVRDDVIAFADYHAGMSDGFTDWPEHSGFHGGPGSLGHCPIIHDRTTISITPLADGVTLHVTTDQPWHVKAVQDDTAQRLASLPRWLSR